MGLIGEAGGSELSNTSWFRTPLSPNQLAKAWHPNPSHSLLVPRVTDHQTFFPGLFHKGALAGGTETGLSSSLLCSPLAWLAPVPVPLGFKQLHLH